MKIRLHKNDLIKILETLKEFPEYENKTFELEYYSCEIGYTLDLIINTKVNKIKGDLKIKITDVDTW